MNVALYGKRDDVIMVLALYEKCGVMNVALSGKIENMFYGRGFLSKTRDTNLMIVALSGKKERECVNGRKSSCIWKREDKCVILALSE